jgi:hypothetical protein
MGVSVRTGAHGAWFEVFYLRPTNGIIGDNEDLNIHGD